MTENKMYIHDEYMRHWSMLFRAALCFTVVFALVVSLLINGLAEGKYGLSVGFVVVVGLLSFISVAVFVCAVYANKTINQLEDAGHLFRYLRSLNEAETMCADSKSQYTALRVGEYPEEHYLISVRPIGPSGPTLEYLIRESYFQLLSTAPQSVVFRWQVGRSITRFYDTLCERRMVRQG